MALKFLEPVVELRRKPGPRPLPMRQAGVDQVMAMVALRNHLRGDAAQQVAKQETRTKATAFLLFVLMVAVLGGLMWAGVHG